MMTNFDLTERVASFICHASAGSAANCDMALNPPNSKAAGQQETLKPC
jgi:hypothetical protein